MDIIAALRDCPPAPCYVLAYSGGVDSDVLLQLIVQHYPDIAARCEVVHVHHGLSKHADAWQRHCEQRCLALGLSLQTIRVSITPTRGESLENVARQQRYAALHAVLPDQGVLLTAHHQDDQAETFLLQALRGSGAAGLSAMPRWRAPHYRPLLSITRAQIIQYATQQQLSVIDDESNHDQRFDRNYCRHSVMPVLKQRWPAATETLSRAAALVADEHAALDELIATLLPSVCPAVDQCAITTLQTYTSSTQRALLRAWIARAGFATPSYAHCQRLLDELVRAPADAQPIVHWPGAQCRRYQERIYIMSPLAPAPTSWQQAWNCAQPLTLPAGLGRLHAKRSEEGGVILPADGQFLVKFRQGGESLQLRGRQHHHKLKDCLQNWQIPPWQRDRIPLVILNDRIACVVEQHITEGCYGQRGWSISWER